jgi:hypothetical protein
MGHPALSDLQGLLDELQVLLTRAENAVLAIEKAPAADVEIEEQAQVLDNLREQTNRLKVLDSLLVSDLERRTPYEERLIMLPEGGSIEVRKSKPRKTWDHVRLKSLVAETILADAIDPLTGSIDVPTTELIQRMLDYVSISSWKVTSLKKAGIDPDKYCEVGPAKATVQVRH